jgi:hypothetical protein
MKALFYIAIGFVLAQPESMAFIKGFVIGIMERY